MSSKKTSWYKTELKFIKYRRLAEGSECWKVITEREATNSELKQAIIEKPVLALEAAFEVLNGMLIDGFESLSEKDFQKIEEVSFQLQSIIKSLNSSGGNKDGS